MHRRVGLFPPKNKPKFLCDLGLSTHRFEKDLYYGDRIGQKRLRDDEEGAEEERGTIDRGEEIEEYQDDVDELEFEAECTSGEDGEEEEDEEEEAESKKYKKSNILLTAAP
jgi:hypothetical protein